MKFSNIRTITALLACPVVGVGGKSIFDTVNPGQSNFAPEFVRDPDVLDFASSALSEGVGEVVIPSSLKTRGISIPDQTRIIGGTEVRPVSSSFVVCLVFAMLR